MARGNRILANEYNDIRSKVVSILGTGSAQRGYGQSIFSSAVTTNEPGARGGQMITKAQWDALRIDISNIKVHQDGMLPPIVTIPAQEVIQHGPNHPNTNYNTIIDQAVLSRFNIAANQSVIATKATQSRTGSWSSQCQCTLTVTFDGGYTVTNADGSTFTATGADHARHFFNSGGEIRFNSSRTGGSSTAQNSAWTNLLNTVGIQRLGAITPAITNFYTLTNSYQTFYQLGASTPYSNNVYRLEALCNNTGSNNATGTANVITFRITWIDNYTDPGPPAPGDEVNGTLTVTVDEFKAAGSLIQGGNFSIASANTYLISPITETILPTLNASFFTIGNLVGVNTPPTQFKATELIAQRDSAAGGTQIYSLSLSSGLTRNTGLGTFFFAAPQGSWTDSNTSPVNFVLIGPHPSGTATLTVTRTGYPNQIIAISVPANSVFSPYNLSRGFPQEFSYLTPTELLYAGQIANTYYESISTPFTVTVLGLFPTWYGLGRAPDADGLAYWARECTVFGITPFTQLFRNMFFNSVNANGPGNVDYQASRLASKSFRPGTGYDKFVDRP